MAADRQAGEDWAAMESQVPNLLDDAYDAITKEPRNVSMSQYQLKGNLSTVTVVGQVFEQWQYKVSGAARLWYAIDDERRILWLTSSGMGHPKATDRSRRRKRG